MLRFIWENPIKRVPLRPGKLYRRLMIGIWGFIWENKGVIVKYVGEY